MLKKLLIVITVLILVSTTIPARAGKPTPPPYPLPGAEIQSEAYPPPAEPLPGVQEFEALSSDPRPGVPYFWGLYPDGSGGWRGYVSIDLGYPDFELTGIVCIQEVNLYTSHCFDLMPHGYNGTLGRTTYHTASFNYCGRWMAYYVILGGLLADLHEPNEYLIRCIFIPWLKRYWY